MIEFKITIQAGESNGVMALAINDIRKKSYPVEALVEGTNVISFEVVVPNKLIFSVSGKNNRRDTVVDKETGEIIQDKFIKVIGLEVDGKPLNEHRVAQMFMLKTVDGDKINSAFWGFNGMIELDLPYEDALDFHLNNLG